MAITTQDAWEKELDAERQESEEHDKIKRKRKGWLEDWTAQYKRTKIAIMGKEVKDLEHDNAGGEENLRQGLEDFYCQEKAKAILQTYEGHIAFPAASDRVKTRILELEGMVAALTRKVEELKKDLEANSPVLSEARNDAAPYGKELNGRLRGREGYREFNVSSDAVYEQVLDREKSLVVQADGETKQDVGNER